MRAPTLLLALAGALLAACSDSGDLARVVGTGPIQGELLSAVHDDHDDEHDVEQEEGHEDEHADEADPAGEPAGELAAGAGTPDAGVEAPAAPADDAGLASDATAAAATAAAAEPPAKPSAPAKPARFDPKAYTWVEFDVLTGFDYPDLVRMDGETPPPELPDEVQALDGERVAFEGFMNPLAFDSGGVKEFSLVADPTFCCFGAVPKMNHWIHVTLPGDERTEFYSFDPVAVYGTLEVGEAYMDGYVVSLYRITADRVEGDF